MSDNENLVAFIVFFKVFLVIATMSYTLSYLGFMVVDENQTDEQSKNNSEITTNETQQITIKLEEKKEIIVQPSCPSSYLITILQDLCEELFIRHEQCTPEDFHNLEKHKIPRNHARNNTTGEPRGTIVGCIAAGLLLTSLGAAFLELYKAKSQTPVKATKPMLSRKCSLADLTVLKHNRKELVRRESIMEIPESGSTHKAMGRKVSRPPLRLD